MPSEINKSSASVSEAIVDHLQGGSEQIGWIKWVALSAMIMALFSAIGALLTGMTANDALMERTEEVLEVSRLASDELHVEVLRSKHELLKSLGKMPDTAEIVRIRAYEKEVKALAQNVQKEEDLAMSSSHINTIFAIGVTLLSMAIAMSGMAIVAGRQGLWLVGLVFGVLGCGFVAFGVVQFL
ncbi:MAG: DUF4337 family protein [Candidatus Latescibacteria bacterium]|nr:DUF4337 family protein [Candidatus Latescibacterota bacterium]MBT5829471.1 DUF4337 family protein [Candidatus Latescibacterota bacterium]